MSSNRAVSDLSPRYWPFDVEWLPRSAYLVGGAVRDALIERKSKVIDLDFVLPEGAVETARQIARHYQAGFVVLDEERQIARVVFENATADFAQQEGGSIEKDLRRRDFTINAIAYNPHTQTFIDPLQGQEDLAKGILRMISKKNLKTDPLRLLRAYRQAAQLNFKIARKTRSALSLLAPLLANVAVERVQTELKYLFAAPEGGLWLSAAHQDGLLTLWFRNLQEENLQQIEHLDQCAWLLGKIWEELHAQLQAPIAPNALSLMSLAKLTCLVASNPKAAESQMENLKYSRAEIRGVTIALKYLPRLLKISTAPMSLREQYFFFQEVGSLLPLLAVLVVTLAAQRDVLQEMRAVGMVAPLINRYLDPDDPVAHPIPLLSGNELMQALQLSPSPQIGKLLTEIQIARIEGLIATPEEALRFAATAIDSA
ncbi:CCA tRNA nucleotidyltransferase [Lusitaniella coriacea LEGE 07157]|uniref:CCA tRNA nucleotidyltransferase n=1 Tax=Lusitaniella coriacea LEGE 07157 TaxID=945747 RepID=A0A8J7J7L6_9CYAN|nr:CCA tRNA nucleotidyltransferase [Lusitaniella coriacea]MBE9115870.1 CCA tRNA nucleotidyltransferase [Lusitaniella coriacea LEGE 07157]